MSPLSPAARSGHQSSTAPPITAPRFLSFGSATVQTDMVIQMPSTQELADMTAFNKPHVASGVILHADGFLSSTHGARVTFFKDGIAPQIKRGPFGLDNLVAGYWIVELASLDDAVEWAKRIPFKAGSVEIRKIAGLEDFGDALTDELKGEEQEMMKTLEQRQKGK
jgi:hypothetical protein